MRPIVRLDIVAQNAAVCVLDLEAVFLHQRHDVVIELHQPFSQDMLHLRLTHLELAQFVKVDLVDGAAGGNESYMHRTFT
jgi:hypothetical protein